MRKVVVCHLKPIAATSSNKHIFVGFTSSVFLKAPMMAIRSASPPMVSDIMVFSYGVYRRRPALMTGLALLGREDGSVRTSWPSLRIMKFPW